MPAPPDAPIDPRTVAVGVMAFYSKSDDHRSADDIYDTYLAKMKYFVRWLVDTGHRVRLVEGDSRFDDKVVQEDPHRLEITPA